MKKSNIFITINLLFILGCCIFYGSRLLYFYRLENPKKIKQMETLEKMISHKGNIIVSGDGLYQNNEEYIFKGKNTNNYLEYDGRLWRIVKMSKNGDIKLITEDAQTSLVWGIDDNFEESYVYDWLNNEKSKIKPFVSSLSDADKLLLTEVCTDAFEKNYSCNNKASVKSGLISLKEYEEAGGGNSYLNNGTTWWTSNTDNKYNAWYVYKDGTINSKVSTGSTYFSFGVRPTITINADLKDYEGTGTKENPYVIKMKQGNKLKDKSVGSYLLYNNYNWRIIEKDEKYIKVVLDGLINENKEIYQTTFGESNYFSPNNGVGYYLNEIFFNTFDNKQFILKHEFNTGRYDKSYKYDYTKIAEYTEKANIGLLQLGELFVNDYNNYFLSTRTITSDNSVYQVEEDGSIYAGSPKKKNGIRPTLYLDANIDIKNGTGDKQNPYLIEKVNYEKK